MTILREEGETLMASRKKKQMGVVRLARGHGFIARVGLERITVAALLEMMDESHHISSVSGDEFEPGEFQEGIWIGLLFRPDGDAMSRVGVYTLEGSFVGGFSRDDYQDEETFKSDSVNQNYTLPPPGEGPEERDSMTEWRKQNGIPDPWAPPESVDAFIARCYQQVTHRFPEAEGLPIFLNAFAQLSVLRTTSLSTEENEDIQSRYEQCPYEIDYFDYFTCCTTLIDSIEIFIKSPIVLLKHPDDTHIKFQPDEFTRDDFLTITEFNQQ